MSNFGFRRLRVVNPYELAFREARSAVGAASLLAQAEEYSSVAEAVADCSLVVGTTALNRRNPVHRVRDLQEGAPLIRKRLARGDVALLFGSEKRGLSNEDFSHCHWLLRIPTREAHRSMNLAQAVAVCLYELACDDKSASATERVRFAKAADLERVASLLGEALQACGYLKGQPGRSTRRPAAPIEEKIRRFVRRMNLSMADAELLLGMLRQIRWKLKTTTLGDLKK